MKLFFKHIVFISIIILLSLIVLDISYTIIISKSSKRNKVENIIHSKNKEFDVIIMGTSRANNHFVPQLFEKRGYKTYNYGISGSHLFETDLLLKLMIQNKFKIKTLLLEADLSVCNEKRDEGTTARFMPYLHTNTIIKEHLKEEDDFFKLYYIPFYRYIKFDNRIGFRELYKVIKNEPTNVLENKGYYPLTKKSKKVLKNNISKLKPIRNKYLDDIKRLCQQNQIKLIMVMTPMCKCTKGIEYFDNIQKIYPEIYNFENAVEDDKYFSSCGHLNNKGAHIFTNYVLNKIRL